jgi:anti-sigma B factor antagonist
VLRVAGELDVATAPALRDALDGLVDGGCQHVDVDVSCVPFCDSSGFHALVDARRRLGRRGGTLELHHPCRSLRLLLELFELTPTLDPRAR